jgi:hypothetical protein
VVPQVQANLADVLLHSGVATSRYAGRLFRPSTTSSNYTIANHRSSGKGCLYTAKQTAATPVAKGVQQQQLQQGTGTDSADSSAGERGLQPAVAAAAAAVASTDGTDMSSSSSAGAAAAADAALAAADAWLDQLTGAEVGQELLPAGVDATVDVESGLKGLIRAASQEPLPLVMQEAHTEQE